eukprot:2201668-Alexandrium_andersonii.AAC.1
MAISTWIEPQQRLTIGLRQGRLFTTLITGRARACTCLHCGADRRSPAASSDARPPTRSFSPLAVPRARPLAHRSVPL